MRTAPWLGGIHICHILYNMVIYELGTFEVYTNKLVKRNMENGYYVPFVPHKRTSLIWSFDETPFIPYQRNAANNK